jgi:hypothetical protein
MIFVPLSSIDEETVNDDSVFRILDSFVEIA